MQGVASSLSSRRYREVPVYRATVCDRCGGRHRIVVRYRRTLLCLDCFRRVRHQDRARLRRLETVLDRATGAEPSSVIGRRFSRLWGTPPHNTGGAPHPRTTGSQITA